MNILKYLNNNSFSKNVLILMTGTSIAQSIPIAISPILTRLYTPDQFGTLAVFIAITSVLTTVVTGKYELAIMLPDNEKDSNNLTVLSLLLTTVISLFLLVLVLIFNTYITVLLTNKEISIWLYFIPFVVFFNGVFNSLNYKFNKDKEYKTLSQTKIIHSTTSSFTSLFFGLIKKFNVGLIIANILGSFSKAFNLFVKTDFNKLFTNSSKKELIVLKNKYIRFPKFTVPHSVFNEIASNLPIFFLNHYFTTKETGFFSFTKRIILLPINLISSSYYQVYFEEFSKKNTNRIKLFKSKFKQISLLFLPFFILIWFLIPPILSFIYGEKWTILGRYAQILIPLYYMKLLSGVFATTAYIYYEKQLESFILEIIITVLIFISLLIGVINKNVFLGLKLMAITNSIIIVFRLYRSVLFTKQKSI